MKVVQSTVAAMQKPTNPKKDRSPNYPMLTFQDALARAKQIYDKDGIHPMNAEVAVKHMGLAMNGRTRMIVAALKHYGLLVSVGSQVKVTEEAKAIFVYPENEPKRAELLRRLAMQPKVFQQLRARFPASLPSDENLAATLQLEMDFTKEAAPALIKVYRHALQFAGVDGDSDATETYDPEAQEEAPISGMGSGADAQKQPPPPPAKTPPGMRQERHSWKLGGNVWAEVIITGTLDSKRLEKLKGFIALLDAEDSEAEGI